MTEPFVKRRGLPTPGSIPDVLQMFRSEVRFYREVAPVVGIRVPGCLTAEEHADGTLLVLENLSEWHPGADPTAAASLLAELHGRWEGEAAARWPWLRRPGAATDLVGAYFDAQWPAAAARADCTAAVRALGERLVGRVPEVEQAAGSAGPATLVHGDASFQNLRTSPTGEVALLDWEDVGAAPGVGDLGWLLVSSVDPVGWDDTVAAYGSAGGLLDVLPAAISQAILCYAGTADGSDEALGWVVRIEETGRRLR